MSLRLRLQQMDLGSSFMKQNKQSPAKYLQELIEVYRREVADGPLSLSAIAIWILQKGSFRPSKEETIKLLVRHLSDAMRTQYTTDPDGRRVRRKHAVKYKETGPDGKKQQEVIWFDIEIAPPHFMHESLQQRRGGIADVCWQLKQDLDSYNKYHNKGEPIQILLNFSEDMEEREASGYLAPPDDPEFQ
jgi:hypothetical protein